MAGQRGSEPTTHDRVRAAAVDLFAERGFHGTGIRDLAEHAGVSSASLYHYMGTKDDLLADLMVASLTRLLRRAEQVAADAADPRERLRALVRVHVAEHAERRQETTVVDGELRALAGPRRAEVLALRDAYDRLWQAAIDDAATRGVAQVADTRLARMAVLDLCTGVAGWYAPDGRLDLETLIARYVELALGLLGVPAATPHAG